MQIHLHEGVMAPGSRVVEVNDPQFARLKDTHLLFLNDNDSYILLDSEHDRLVGEAHWLVSENGENPEYDRALVELVSRFLDLTDDDRDIVAILIGVKKTEVQA